MRSRPTTSLVLAAVFAALYAVGVVILAPISFQLVQVRVADALLPLSILFGWPAVVGLTVGAFVANFFGGLGPVDMLGGAVANFLATFAAWGVAKNSRSIVRMLAGVAVEVLIVTFVVGSYLSYLLGFPIEAGWLGVFAGSVVAIGIIGTLLLLGLSRGRAQALLREYGVAGATKTD
jgi:uncharacterized membrane protein